MTVAGAKRINAKKVRRGGASLNPGQMERYARHIILPEIGGKGQMRLLRSKALVIGAGGLGSTALLYLAGAGVGTIGIVDDDHIERSNLQRQIIHQDKDIGAGKAASAAKAIHRLNPDIECRVHPQRIHHDNAEDIIQDYDIVIDGSDNFPTRYLINDTCHRLGIAVIFAAVRRFEAQIMVLGNGSACYRCLFPHADPAAGNCADQGILGAVAGLAGCLQAIEAIKTLLAIGHPLTGRLVLYDALEGHIDTIEVNINDDCDLCRPTKPGTTQRGHPADYD